MQANAQYKERWQFLLIKHQFNDFLEVIKSTESNRHAYKMAKYKSH